MSDAGFWEFMLPYTYDGSDELFYLTLDLNAEGRVTDITSSEFPPSDDGDCSELAEDFENNYQAYYQAGLVYDAMSDEHGIYNPDDLRREMETGKIRFIF